MQPPRDAEEFLKQAKAASAARLAARGRAIGHDLLAIADPRRLARHRPWLAVGGAMAAGWIVCRLLRPPARPAPPATPPPTPRAPRSWTAQVSVAVRRAFALYRSWERIVGPLVAAVAAAMARPSPPDASGTSSRTEPASGPSNGPVQPVPPPTMESMHA